MQTAEGLTALTNSRLMVISRGLGSKQLLPVADALLDGGVRVLEITMNTDGAPRLIERLVQHAGERMFVGAGTVTNVAEARTALAAGAQFLVTPNTDVAVIELANKAAVPIFPGAYTPTEIVVAWQSGASAVKIFPTGSRTLEIIRELQGPLGHIPMMALGGIDATNVSSFIRLGCYAVGVGSSVLDQRAIANGDYQQITKRAAELVRAIELSKRDENDLLN
jgi:2-dehydro-3-deoxyphosphogluconate aldolase/(4S)-4-hydroxy-2-oxoglutarate aldolase